LPLGVPMGRFPAGERFRAAAVRALMPDTVARLVPVFNPLVASATL